MINFEIIEELKNLKENENILKILDIFWWNLFKWLNKYYIIDLVYIYKLKLK